VSTKLQRLRTPVRGAANWKKRSCDSEAKLGPWSGERGATYYYPVRPNRSSGPGGGARPCLMVSEQFRTVRIRKSKNDGDSRPADIFSAGARRPPHGVAGNHVRTTKYLHNPLTALPKQLFQQFRRLFNVFWLLQCIVVLIPGLAPYNSSTTISGFAFVLLVSLAKDFYEDHQRLKADRQANAQPIEVLRDGSFVRIPSWQLLVGDIVRVSDGEFFPADLAVIATSNQDGLCLVETASLDGEKNLKRYFAMAPTAGLGAADVLHRQLNALIRVDLPNNRLYELTGQLRVKPADDTDAREPADSDQVSAINVENVCLRASKLKQTEFAIGVTIYAGMESKIQVASLSWVACLRLLRRHRLRLCLRAFPQSRTRAHTHANKLT